MAALVIGVAAYPEGNDLKNPVNDANDLASKLKGYGFEVIVATDCKAVEMAKSLRAFGSLLQTHDIGLFFFAGHGMQIDGQNYLLGVDTDMETETDAKHSSLPLDKVVDVMARSKASTKIIVLDACRNNPWERRWHRGPGTRGLASVYAPKGTIIGFATSPGEVAFDGIGRNGTYTSALLQHIDTPDCSIETMFKRVRNTVAAASGNRQTSWEHTSLSGEFYFNLSIASKIEKYSGKALADQLYPVDPSRPSDEIIAGLKTYDWYRQNPALAKLTAETAKGMESDSLFVVGRNIYQAACGGSNSAMGFIQSFVTRTTGFGVTAREAILDGMLFEVFFNATGELRRTIKSGGFDEVFELQKFEILEGSFDFISDALTSAGGEFYVLPGRDHELSASVSVKKLDSGFLVDAIYVDSKNVLSQGDGGWTNDDGSPAYDRIGADRLSEALVEQLVVPTRSLRVAYTDPDAQNSTELRIPYGWTVRKGPSDTA